MAKKKNEKYGLGKIVALKRVPAPNLPYQPRDPRTYKPGIGLIGCGGITVQHLTAYKRAGYRVIALCDVDPKKAAARQKEFYPKATVFSDYRDVLSHPGVEVVDVATHPDERGAIIEAALNAKKHVLSQKPCVLDLDFGERLADLADRQGVRFAVNQNGRYAPHISYIRQALKAGLIGDVLSAHMSVHWNHNWVAGTPFDKVRHLVLYDFAIHWFDMLNCIMGTREPLRVYASNARSAAQKALPPLLAQALIEYDGAQASVAFDADTAFGPHDRTFIVGTRGTLTSSGKDLTKQTVTLHTKKGVASPKLKGTWFPDGFHGTMAELLCAIEENREPENSVRHNLKSLALCFAACRSADSHLPAVPGAGGNRSASGT